MFWKKRKRREEKISDQLQAESAKIVEILKRKWVEFQTMVPFPADVPLTHRIEAFIVPAREGILKHYPIMRMAPPGLIWEMVFAAVIESKTHLPDDVSKARASLAAKYSQGVTLEDLYSRTERFGTSVGASANNTATISTPTGAAASLLPLGRRCPQGG